jgi:HSP20 family protein
MSQDPKDPERQWRYVREMMEHILFDSTRHHVSSRFVWRPATDVYEEEGQFVVRVDVSGIRREDLSITLTNGELAIRGIRRDTIPPGKKHFYKMEIAVGPFERIIPLPEGFDAGEGTGVYRDGLLEIRIRRSAPREAVDFAIRIE